MSASKTPAAGSETVEASALLVETAGVSYALLSVTSANIAKMGLHDVKAEGALFRNANLRGSIFNDCNLGEVVITGCNLTNMIIDDCKMGGMTINGKSVVHALNATFGGVDIVGKEGLAWRVAEQVMRGLNISKTAYADCTSLGEAAEALCGDWHDAVMGQMDNFSAGKLGELAACWQPADKWTPEARAMMRPASGRTMSGAASYDYSGQDTLIELATMAVLEAMMRIMRGELK
jgi:hypothetical protein